MKILSRYTPNVFHAEFEKLSNSFPFLHLNRTGIKKNFNNRVQQIAYTMYKCTVTNLLSTSSSWKPYKVLYANITYF